MMSLQERLESGTRLIAIIDRAREETGNPYLASDLERDLIDRVICDLEEEAWFSRR